MTFYNLYVSFCEMNFDDSFHIAIITPQRKQFLHYTDWYEIPQELKQKEVHTFSGSDGVWHITFK